MNKCISTNVDLIGRVALQLYDNMIPDKGTVLKLSKRSHFSQTDGDDEDEGDDTDRSTRRHRETLISVKEDATSASSAKVERKGYRRRHRPSIRCRRYKTFYVRNLRISAIS